MSTAAYAKCHPEQINPDFPHLSLTPREMQVTRQILSGKTSREIGKELFITFKTVEAHRSSIMYKLKVHSVAGLFHYFAGTNILQDVIDNGP